MDARHLLQQALSGLAELLAPRTCAACQGPLSGPSAICADCGTIERLRDVELHLERVPIFAGARYREPLASAITRFKYENHPELAADLAELMLPCAELFGVEPTDVWVPVPLHPRRLAERGYNQSALLARRLARRSSGTVAARALGRARETAQQARLRHGARQDNVAEAFVVQSPPRGRVILVDDVVTTGSTLRACIAALRASGCELLGCAAVARAIQSKP